MSGEIEGLINDIQVNLQRVIRIADDISQDYRRSLLVQEGRNVKLLKELLITDNLIRDTIAQLRKATSSINFNTDKETLLHDEAFLNELYGNLAQMFRSFESIYKVMEFDQSKVDSLVMDTIQSLEEYSKLK